MRDRRVPTTSFALVRDHKGRAGKFRTALDSVLDRAVGMSSRALGDDLDRRLAALSLQANEAGFDAFGADSFTMRCTLPWVAYMYRWYFRAETTGIERIPKGRVLLVANHSGQIPIDGVMIVASLVLDGEPPRLARGMIDKWIATLPFFSIWFPRVGQAIGSPENARRLVEREEALVVFPEGIRGISKTFDKRYQLTDFGLGFMRLALETKTPIVPIAVIGGEEQYVSVANWKSFGQFLGIPSFPVVPQLLLYPFPFPTKYRMVFGEPLHFQGDPDDEDAAIEEKVWVVRTTIEGMLRRGLKERRAVFW